MKKLFAAVLVAFSALFTGAMNVFAAEDVAIAPRTGGSPLPLIIGIAVIVIAVILVVVLITTKKK